MKRTIFITSISPKKPVEAEGNDVTICDRNRSIKINGPIGKLSVSGRHNQVEASHADVLGIAGEGNHVQITKMGAATVSGGGNRVSWANPTNGSDPLIETHGYDNEVTRIQGSAQAATPAQAAAPAPAPTPAPAPVAAKPVEEPKPAPPAEEPVKPAVSDAAPKPQTSVPPKAIPIPVPAAAKAPSKQPIPAPAPAPPVPPRIPGQ